MTALAAIEGADTAAAPPGFKAGTADVNPTTMFYGPLGEDSGSTDVGAISETLASVNTTLGVSMAGWVVAAVGGKGGTLFGFGTGGWG